MLTYINRSLESTLTRYIGIFPVVGITGSRQSGKSTLLKHLLSNSYSYVSFDDYRFVLQFKDDPEKFFRIYSNRVIFDEVQKVPEIFDYIKIAVDNDRENYGKYILTGSAQFAFLQRTSESLAGRIGLLSLLPFGFSEIPNVNHEMQMTFGSYPELVTRNFIAASDWYSSYLDTYISRDLRTLSNIGDLSDFRKFMQILAGRCAQILNMSDIAHDLGLTVHTVKKWISILEASYIVFLVKPFYKNYGKRLIKAPKIYFYDTGIVNFLLGTDNFPILQKSPLYGPVFENFIVSEILKKEKHLKSNAEIYYYRSNYGLEVDLIVDKKTSKEWIEIKASETYRPAMVSAIEKLMEPGDTGWLLYNGINLPNTENLKISNFREYLLNV
jgi:predicted AAA+ superfamily ATPase